MSKAMFFSVHLIKKKNIFVANWNRLKLNIYPSLTDQFMNNVTGLILTKMTIIVLLEFKAWPQLSISAVADFFFASIS